MRRTRDVPGLVKLLSHPDPHTRVKAVDSLGYVGDSRAMRPLINALQDENPYVREHAARNLGCDYHSSLGCDTGEAVRPLISILDDEDPFVRVEGARSLGEHPLPVARAPLEKLAKQDQRWEVRQAAAFALGRVGTSESLPLLESMLDDREPQVVKTVREAIRRIGIKGVTAREGDEERLRDVDVSIGSHSAEDHLRRAEEDAGASSDGGSQRGDNDSGP